MAVYLSDFGFLFSCREKKAFQKFNLIFLAFSFVERLLKGFILIHLSLEHGPHTITKKSISTHLLAKLESPCANKQGYFYTDIGQVEFCGSRLENLS